MRSPSLIDSTDHLLFPVRVTTLRFESPPEFHQELTSFFAGTEQGHPEKSVEQFEQNDQRNLLPLCASCPALAVARDMFLLGLKLWMKGEGIEGRYSADMWMFPAYYTSDRHFVPAHNHMGHITSIYYVNTADPGERPIVNPGKVGDYFKIENGVLILHDPKFNASLTKLTDDEYAKIVPRPGLMVVMPGSLWHTVTPSEGEVRRLALVADFTLRKRNDTEEPTYTFEL